MGQESSATTGGYNHPFMGDTYVPISSSLSTEDLAVLAGGPKHHHQHHTVSRAQGTILKSEYYGIWSIVTPTRVGPSPRMGSFSVTDEVRGVCYTGCGLSSKKELRSDIWALDLNTKEWTPFQTTGDIISPRVGSVATMFRDYIILFGGFARGKYFDDLYVININTHEVSLLNPKGDLPTKRSSPIMHVVDESLYLWGGFNGEWPNELYVLDLKTLTWTKYLQTVSGRTAIPSVVYGKEIIGYGGTRTNGMLIIDTETKIVRTEQTSGAEPPPLMMNAGMILAGKYLIFFGGKSETKYTLVYGCDIEKKWWFVFHIAPDEETVSIKDGRLSEIGLFMVPRIHSFGVTYNQKTREIIAFLGAPEVDPSPLFIVNIGESLSILNIRKDMSLMLKK